MSHLLSAGELKLSPPEGLDAGRLVLGLGANGHDWLTNVDAGHGALWLAPRPTHTRLEPGRKVEEEKGNMQQVA